MPERARAPAHDAKTSLISMEAIGACQDSNRDHDASTPHRAEANGIAERAARRATESTSAQFSRNRVYQTDGGEKHGRACRWEDAVRLQNNKHTQLHLPDIVSVDLSPRISEGHIAPRLLRQRRPREKGDIAGGNSLEDECSLDCSQAVDSQMTEDKFDFWNMAGDFMLSPPSRPATCFARVIISEFF